MGTQNIARHVHFGHTILQARVLEWVAISFSNAWKWKVKVKSLSRVWLLATPWNAYANTVIAYLKATKRVDLQVLIVIKKKIVSM